MLWNWNVSIYATGAGAAVLVFSTVDRASFEDLPWWRDKVMPLNTHSDQKSGACVA
jgi:hypothetical protein